MRPRAMQGNMPLRATGGTWGKILANSPGKTIMLTISPLLSMQGQPSRETIDAVHVRKIPLWAAFAYMEAERQGK